MSPIILPFKEHSVRCPDKNFILYNATIEWLMGDETHDGIANLVEKWYSVLESNRIIQFI